MIHRCPECAGPVSQPVSGRRRRFCCGACRKDWNAETSRIRNEARWLYGCADEAEEQARALQARGYNERTIVQWLENAEEKRAEAAALEQLVDDRVAGHPVT